jgi:arylsulfatase A-like enzyme
MRVTTRLGMLVVLSFAGYACEPANQAPVWEGPGIIPDDPGREVALSVSTDGLHDPDSDPLTQIVDWSVNGELVVRSVLLDPAFFRRGDTVQAHVQASDGLALSEPRDTPEVVIRNTSPQILVASIESASAIHGFSEIEAVAAVLDLDGDPVSIQWKWFLDEAPLSLASDQIVLPGVPAGSQLTAVGTPYDDTGPGETYRTQEVEVGAVPVEIASVRIEPEMEPSTAPVNQAASPVEIVGGEVPWRRTTAGDRWTCTVSWPGGLALESRVEIDQGPPGGNILLVLLDDVGIDNIGAYGEHPNPPPTPTINSLAEQGVLFRNHYTYPLCSPSRAALLTGRYGYRTGIGTNVKGSSRLPTDEIGIAEALDYSTHYNYSNSMVGKWHLAGPQTPNWLTHPAGFGFDWYSVMMSNLYQGKLPKRQFPPAYVYQRWLENLNGEDRITWTYITTQQTNKSIWRIRAMPQPWFLFLSYTAPHTPLHNPPRRLHSYGPDIRDKTQKYGAMLESADTELGRLLKAVGPEILADTTIIVMGDNGTPYFAVTAPFEPSEAKGRLHDGGTRVPMIISGPLVAEAGSEVTALTHSVDIFATIAEIAGVEIDKLSGSDNVPGLPADWSIDGESLIPFLKEPDRSGREIVYTEKFVPNGRDRPRSRGKRSVRDERWRLIRSEDGRESLYDLAASHPNSGPNLLDETLSEEAARAWYQLSIDLDQIEADIAQD